MTASKENAKLALAGFRAACRVMTETQYNFCRTELAQIEGFLVAAERKLPSEAAFAKDKKRRSILQRAKQMS